MFEGVNEVAILVTSILSVAAGSVWYSPLLFGEQWMRAAGLEAKDLAMSTKQIFLRVVLGVVANLVLFYVLARFINASRTGGDSLWALGIALVLFLTASTMSTVIWEKRSWLYIIIHIGYAAVAIFGGLGVLAFWPW
jgi:hypothetical protein